MSTDTSEQEIDRWLDSATRGVDRRQRDWIRTELRDHYDDTVRDHLLRGVSPLAAHEAALQTLGSAGETRRGLVQTHNAPKHYLIAAAAAMVFPLVLIIHLGSIWLWGIPVEKTLYNTLTLVSVLVMLKGMNRRLSLQYNVSAERRIFVIALGFSAMSLAPIFASILDHAAVDLGLVEMTASDTWGYNLLIYLWIGGAICTGIGLVWLATTMLNIPTALHDGKLTRALAYLLVLDGYAVAFSNVATALNYFAIAWFSQFPVLIICTITHVTFTYTFFRAAQPTSFPHQLV